MGILHFLVVIRLRARKFTFVISLPMFVAAPNCYAQPGKAKIPYVGCRFGGQLGLRDALDGETPNIRIAAADAKRVAYYGLNENFGVIGPRGWNCFGGIGSGGGWLSVVPGPIDANGTYAETGPVVFIASRDGNTPGRYDIAAVITRVFPAYLSLAKRELEEFNLNYVIGPYPKDKLAYKSKRVVEYETPADTDGLGTALHLIKKGSLSIRGVAMLVGKSPDLLLLSVRLPGDLVGEAAVIINQVESQARRTLR